MVHRILCRLDLSCITSWRTRCHGVMINHSIIRKIVGVMAARMEDRNSYSICSNLWTGCVGFIDPNALGSAINAKITQAGRFKVIEPLFGNRVP